MPSDRTFGLLLGKQKRWPNPQDSTGVFLATLGRKKSCWEATGPARSAFNVLQVDIAQYINQTCDAVQKGVVWSLYMVGSTRESASPIIAFISCEPGPRERLRTVIKESNLLDKYPGFLTMTIDRPVGCLSGVVKTLGASLGMANHSATSVGEITVSMSSTQFMGSRITLKEQGLRLVATGGGCFQFNNKLFMVSVAHPFEELWEDNFLDVVAPGSYNFDIDDPIGIGEEESMMASTSDGSITSSSDSCGESNSSLSVASSFWSDDVIHEKKIPGSNILKNKRLDTTDIVGDLPTLTKYPHKRSYVRQGLEAKKPLQNNGVKVLDFTINSPAISSARGGTTGLDYALFELPTFETDGFGLRFEKYYLAGNPTSIARHPKSTQVVVHTTSGIIAGRLVATPSYKQLEAGILPQQLWSVIVEGNLEKGICGSWVVDAASNEVYGHIIAGSPEDGFAYIIPFYEILDDLNAYFGNGWALAGSKNALGKNVLKETSLLTFALLLVSEAIKLIIISLANILLD